MAPGALVRAPGPQGGPWGPFWGRFMLGPLGPYGAESCPKRPHMGPLALGTHGPSKSGPAASKTGTAAFVSGPAAATSMAPAQGMAACGRLRRAHAALPAGAILAAGTKAAAGPDAKASGTDFEAAVPDFEVAGPDKGSNNNINDNNNFPRASENIQ